MPSKCKHKWQLGNTKYQADQRGKLYVGVIEVCLKCKRFKQTDLQEMEDD